jgi:hypothetical protein
VSVAPTLAAMAEIYRLDRAGGASSPRFRAYLAHAEHEHALAAYNPMAGPEALATVERLLELDAEAIAGRHAEEAEIAVVVSSPGLWTDRIATEVELRTDPGPPALVRFWAGEPIETADVDRESAAAATRARWLGRHGPARTLEEVLAREGSAYVSCESPFGLLEAGEATLVGDAVALLGASELRGEIAAVLFGDPGALALGWTPLGLPWHAGYRWAVARAHGAL